MATKRISVLFACLALVVGLGLTGCGEEEQTGTFKAYLQHFGGDDLVPGIEIIVLKNDTGVATDLEAVTDASGWVPFGEEILDEAVEDEDGNLVVGFRAVTGLGGGATYVNTYQFNIEADALDERLWVVDQTTYDGAPLMAGVTKNDGTPGLDPGTAVLAGGFYWVDPDDP